MKLNVAVVLGTRPEIIKMAPIIRELQRKKINFFIVHTGQHYSYNLDRVFFEQLRLPKPQYKLEVGSMQPGKQTALIISRTEKILEKKRPSVVLVEGDTNTVLGGALAARKLNIPIGHVESGLRSYDEQMPEEWNRRLTDHCSDFLFVPTKKAKEILLGEGIAKKKIFLTGNTIVDSVLQNLKNSKKSDILEKFGVTPKQFFLVSLHRQENVDNLKRFKNLVKGLKKVRREFDLPIIFPIHPRSKKMAKKFHIDFEKIDLIEPVDYFTFLFLENNARMVLTDSGGIQEETCILKVPCVTLRENTERPETLEVGSNIIAGTEPNKIVLCVKKMLKRKTDWENPFGNGKSASKIVKILETKKL